MLKRLDRLERLVAGGDADATSLAMLDRLRTTLRGRGPVQELVPLYVESTEHERHVWEQSVAAIREGGSANQPAGAIASELRGLLLDVLTARRYALVDTLLSGYHQAAHGSFGRFVLLHVLVLIDRSEVDQLFSSLSPDEYEGIDQGVEEARRLKDQRPELLRSLGEVERTQT